MTTYERLTRPATLLAAGMAVAFGLMLAPGRWIEPIRGIAQSALRPGQTAVFELRRRGGSIVGVVRSHGDLVARLAEAERDRQRLEAENHRLAAELAEARGRAAVGADSAAELAAERLLVGQYVPARTLGQQARAFLLRRHVLDVGSQAGIEPGSLVVDPRPGLIDRGKDAQLRTGQLVVSQGRVWGKIATVGPLTSVVQTITERGYRDLVFIGQPPNDRAASARPQGIVEGSGESLARIRLVEVTQPVAAGDAVYSATAADILPEPLLYGRVARVERPVGAAHWDIWMEPAIAAGRPERVAVLQAELNPVRVAAGKQAKPAE